MTRGPGERLLSGILVVVVLSGACVTTATIRRNDGPPLKGDVAGGSKRSVFIRDASGSQQRVLRADIAEIDHPGGAAMVTGVVLVALGIAGIIFGARGCASDSVAYCVPVFGPAAVGLTMIGWGSSVSRTSRLAARDRSRDDDDPGEGPVRPIPSAAAPAPAPVVRPPTSTDAVPDAGTPPSTPANVGARPDGAVS